MCKELYGDIKETCLLKSEGIRDIKCQLNVEMKLTKKIYRIQNWCNKTKYDLTIIDSTMYNINFRENIFKWLVKEQWPEKSFYG